MVTTRGPEWWLEAIQNRLEVPRTGSRLDRRYKTLMLNPAKSLRHHDTCGQMDRGYRLSGRRGCPRSLAARLVPIPALPLVRFGRTGSGSGTGSSSNAGEADRDGTIASSLRLADLVLGRSTFCGRLVSTLVLGAGFAVVVGPVETFSIAFRARMRLGPGSTGVLP